MALAGRPVANPVVVLREESDDWALLFNPDSAEVVGLNPVGVAVWKLIDGQRSLEEIVCGLDDCFDEVSPGAAAEVEAFLDDLVRRGFVGFALEEDRP